MDIKESLLLAPINPNNFPAKLWHLVNSDHYQSIGWDSLGEGIIIDQHLFECELLSPAKPMNEASDMFKTTNFASFIRQLNLYGFRKVVMESDGGPCRHQRGRHPRVGESHRHHFYSVHFRRDHPDLLVHLKRLTSTNRARMAAGLKVNTRPPNRLQRFVSHALAEQRERQGLGVITLEQTHRAYRNENLAPYSYVSPASHGHIGLPLKEFNRSSVPSRTWQSLLSVLQRQAEPPAPFPGSGFIFPMLQRFPADVSYAMRTSATAHHIQQCPPAVSHYSGYIPPPAQYSQAYYPSAVLQCCTMPAHMERLESFSSPAMSSYQHYSYFQNPSPVPPSFTKEFFKTNWPSSDPEESKRKSVNSEAAFQFVDELQSSPPLEIVKLDEEDEDVQDKTLSLDTSDKTLDVEQMELHISDPSEMKVATEDYMDPTRHMPKRDKSADLRLLVEVACSQELFTKQDELASKDVK